MSPEGEYDIKRYEYEFIDEPTLVLFGGKLNSFAAEGWRLVAMVMERKIPGDYFIGIVEREVQ